VPIASDILGLVGNTPLVQLSRIGKGLKPRLVAKLEMLNPGGSVKDRIGLAMIEEAEKRGALKPGGTIVEPTSGNTGVGLAIAAALKGYRLVCTMPDKQSQEKRDILRAYGAEVVICPTAVAPEDPSSYYKVAERLAKELPGGFMPGQYWNQQNVAAHYKTTGAVDADRGEDHAFRPRYRDRRHGHRRGPLPQGAEPEDPDRRRRSGGLDLHR
jgi:cystathionine beta-synthase